jgi:hypothetical protein
MLRRELCLECARLMADEGVEDFQLAKRKAEERLGVPGRSALPTNREIDDALHDYLHTFHAEALRVGLLKYLQLAVGTMRMLAPFEPRLIGSVLRNHVTEFTPVKLHVFALTFEDVSRFLIEQGIPYRIADKRLRFNADRYQQLPACLFYMDDTMIEVVVFPLNGKKQAPLSPVDGRPMRRADLKEAECLARGCQESASTSASTTCSA